MRRSEILALMPAPILSSYYDGLSENPALEFLKQLAAESRLSRHEFELLMIHFEAVEPDDHLVVILKGTQTPEEASVIQNLLAYRIIYQIQYSRSRATRAKLGNHSFLRHVINETLPFAETTRRSDPEKNRRHF